MNALIKAKSKEHWIEVWDNSPSTFGGDEMIEAIQEDAVNATLEAGIKAIQEYPDTETPVSDFVTLLRCLQFQTPGEAKKGK